MSTRPKRAAASKATAANTAIASGKTDTAAPARAPKNSKKRAAPGPSTATDPAADDGADDDDGDEDDGSQPKKKKAKTAKAKAAPKTKAAPRKGRGKKSAPAIADSDNDADDAASDNDNSGATQGAAASKSSSATAAPAPPPKSPTPPKMVTVLKRGAAPVDPYSGFSQTHQVLTNNGEVYDAMLHQTDVGKNSNKFYGPFPVNSAIGEFEKQFKAKTVANWADRRTMVRKNGKYFWIERDFEADEDQEEEEDEPAAEGSDEKGKGKEKPREKTPESTAPEEVQLPLGKLSKATILQGFSVLKVLSEVLEQPGGPASTSRGGLNNACEQLSGDYYSIIPHAFGRNRPIPIRSKEHLKKELELVDALGDMTIASKLIQAKPSNGLNQIDSRLEGLNLKSIEPLAPSSNEFKVLETYCHDSAGRTHSHMSGFNVVDIFKVERNGEAEMFNGAGFDALESGQRMLLWHGSRTTNFGGILSQGLRIAPPEAPVTGYMFGKGVYFADASTKSLGYTHYHLSDQTGLLLLCEVATAPLLELQDADYNAADKCKAANALATKGVGGIVPSGWKDVAELTGNDELKGVVMPVGKFSEDKRKNLWYNEYIVYDTKQIRLRYLLRVSFKR
ncbi:hypothetical protein FRC04_004634 [Tulasnella sp. 424]|nr:hypothetical protein FRC04_004634 [Tulasnella sp. 424]KAG8963937.1 hypothetical protein FRC05_004339 [Tulasnella sp. 425]